MIVHKTVVLGVIADRLFAAALFILGAIVSFFGWQYGVGQINNIGPGAFPLGLGIILMALALPAAFASGQRDVPVRLAPAMLVPIGIIAWALLIDWAGLLIATSALIGICGMANEKLRPLFLVGLALALTAVGYIVFILGFKLPLALVGGI
jgi:hypothetical protein